MTDSLELLITDYLADCRNEGKAARSLAVYRQALDDYAGWTAARGRPDDLDRASIKKWLSRLADTGHTPGGIKIKYASLRAFCNWLVREGIIEASPRCAPR